MERQQTFQFSDEELDILERALAMYNAYTWHVDFDNHKRTNTMHRQFFDLTHDHTYEEHRNEFASIHGRCMDLSDFSDFDFYEHLQNNEEDELNTYRVNYFEDGERIEDTFEGDTMRVINGESYVIEQNGGVVWSHDVSSTNTVKEVEE